MSEMQPSDSVDDVRTSKRVAYPFVQSVAPYYEGAKINQANFIEVVCQDLSVSGFSFWINRPPKCGRLLVKLQADPLTAYLVVEVRHITQRDTPSGPMSLVGCQFQKRIGKIKPIVEKVEPETSAGEKFCS